MDSVSNVEGDAVQPASPATEQPQAEPQSVPSLTPHVYRVGSQGREFSKESDLKPDALRKQIEPWLTAVFQSEHLSLLLGCGFTAGVAAAAGGTAASMEKCQWPADCQLTDKVDQHAQESAKVCGRGAANFEDQLRVAMRLHAGLAIMDDAQAEKWSNAINARLREFMLLVLASERSIVDGADRTGSEELLVSFLLSFASRAAARERLNLFTTNYDRVVEHGCDLVGLHVLDRFVGALSPVFRSSRLSVDMHYNPPGMRGEPRYLEGVIRLSKLHGSLDWRWFESELIRVGLPFGADEKHPAIPKEPFDSVMIFPNAAKDVETLDYPYAELFRDFAASICRPNSSLVTYGYGFGDDHINRVIADMLTIPSTHLVIVARDSPNPAKPDDASNAGRQRIIRFCAEVGRRAQISLLLGGHFGDLATLVEYYLPKPAIDQITFRKAELEERRGFAHGHVPGEEHGKQAD
jgi:hypothetical protein